MMVEERDIAAFTFSFAAATAAAVYFSGIYARAVLCCVKTEIVIVCSPFYIFYIFGRGLVADGGISAPK